MSVTPQDTIYLTSGTLEEFIEQYWTNGIIP